MSSSEKKLIRGGLKVIAGCIFPPAAPVLLASELMNYAVESTLQEEADSVTGKVMKGAGKLLSGGIDSIIDDN
jgi:hypothetical protein